MKLTETYRSLFDEANAEGLLLARRDLSSTRHICRLVTSGVAVSPLRGIYDLADHWESLDPVAQSLHLIRTLARLHPGWVFCGPSAAILHGLYVAFPLARRIHVRTGSHSSTRSTEVIVRHAYDPIRIDRANGILTTDPEQTVFDCARTLPLVDALPIADSAMRLCGASHESFERCVGEHACSRGIARARTVLGLADPRSESGGESVARAVMIEQGFALPDLQVGIPDPLNPRHVYRADFLWRLEDGRIIAGELDGREKYANPAMTHGDDPIGALTRERLRESRISATGVQVMRFSYADVMNVRFFVRLLESFGIPRQEPGCRSRCSRHAVSQTPLFET